MQNHGNSTSDIVDNEENIQNSRIGGDKNEPVVGVDNDKKKRTERADGNGDIRLYTKRWFLLALFMLYTSNAALPWAQFACLTNIVSQYYNISRTLVEWTSIMIMGARAFVLIPALFLMDKLVSYIHHMLALPYILQVNEAMAKKLFVQLFIRHRRAQGTL